MKTINLGIIGGGLMGKEAASACARWFTLQNFDAQLVLTAVCDVNPAVLEWYKAIPTVTMVTGDYKTMLADASIDVVYVAVPHNLHEEIYMAVLAAGKDLLAEKPFGIDLGAALRIEKAVEASGKFVRCSSEFPFLPGAQRVMAEVQSGRLGKILEVNLGFHHSSDLDPTKPVNWKRQNKTCGTIGVLGDLGMHVCHIPLRLGWNPISVYANLQKIYTERPDGKGGMAVCDTWDNAMLNTKIDLNGNLVPMRLEMKRMAPGETNTWFAEIIGTEGGVRFSTKEPKTLWIFERQKEQWWKKTDLGFSTQFPTITGGIFEVGFPDCFMQMLAAYVAEREGFLGERFGCATVGEAVDSQRIFAAALASEVDNQAIEMI